MTRTCQRACAEQNGRRVTLVLTLTPGLTSDMAPRRRPRGSLVDPVNLGYEVERASKAKLERLADNAGVSGAVMFEHVMEHLSVTAQGLPASWPAQQRDGELPIDPA